MNRTRVRPYQQRPRAAISSALALLSGRASRSGRARDRHPRCSAISNALALISE